MYWPSPVAELRGGAQVLSYAHMDIIDCIEWQLAERSDRLEENPFVPLMRCYAAGFYPFSLGPTLVIMFAFNE